MANYFAFFMCNVMYDFGEMTCAYAIHFPSFPFELIQ